MFTISSRILPVLLLLIPAWPVLAGTPALDETCEDSEKRRVMTRYDVGRRLFAEVEQVPSHERREAMERGLSEFVIVVNPERYFLGRWTQQWLYLRQCAHINERHPVATEGLHGLRIRDEEVADCWAVRRLIEGSDKLLKSALYAIERDMERVMKESRWDEVLPGPRRRISLSSCMR